MRLVSLPDLLVFDREFVVVGDLLADEDRPLGVDDDLVGAVNLDHFSIAVRLQGGIVQPAIGVQVAGVQQQQSNKPTSQQWFINRARLPHLVASTT